MPSRWSLPILLVFAILVANANAGSFGSAGNKKSKESTSNSSANESEAKLRHERNENAMSLPSKTGKSSGEKLSTTSKNVGSKPPVALKYKGLVRAAYDDELEEEPEDEESSARSRGLQDTVVRTTVVGVVRAANLLADASKKGWNMFQSLTGHRSRKDKEKVMTDITEVSEAIEAGNHHSKAQSGAADKTTNGAKSQNPANVKVDGSLGATGAKADADSERAVAHGSKDESVKQSSEALDFVRLGKNSFERQYVQAVGDLDNNGVSDFVVRSPLENYSTGAIRVYLMEKGGVVKSSRHLVPGKWGFDPKGASLKKGDRFGSSVFEIGDVNGDGVRDLAVSAPGEKIPLLGSLYVLFLASDGSVVNTQVVEKFPAGFEAEPCDEASQHSIVRRNEIIARLLKTDAPKLQLSAKAAVGDCFFSETHCQCLKLASASTCLDFVEKRGDGKSVCTERACEDSYKCSCDDSAKEYCERSSGTRDVYVKVEPLSDGKVECKKEQTATELATVLAGVPVPDQKPIGSSGISQSGVWSATECACTTKGSLTDPGMCPQFDHTDGPTKFCVSRACKISSTDMICDISGKSICSRKQVQKTIFINDGTAADPSFVKCHEETVERETVECTSKCP